MKTPALESPFNKITGLRSVALSKNDTIRDVFQWILPNFQEPLFYGTPPDNRFWIFHSFRCFLSPSEPIKTSFFLFLYVFYHWFWFWGMIIMNLKDTVVAAWKHTFLGDITWNLAMFCWLVMLCAIWYHLYNSKNVKNIHGGVLLLVKLQA